MFQSAQESYHREVAVAEEATVLPAEELERRRREEFRAAHPYRYASGGIIRGSGGPHSDRIPLLASSGEYIINAEAANKIGLPVLGMLNQGNLPRFANGGDSLGRSAQISVDTDGIAEAIKTAVIEALGESSVVLDTSELETAVSRAFSRIDLPKLEVDVTDVRVPVEVPTGLSIPVDVAGAQVPVVVPQGLSVPVETTAGAGAAGGLGADIRDILPRLEAVEGRAQAALDVSTEAQGKVEETLAQVDNTSDQILGQAYNAAQELISGVEVSTDIKLGQQEQTLLNKLEFELNDRFDKDTTATDVEASLKREVAELNNQLTELTQGLQEAVRLATSAFSLARSTR
jgi:hypothetical protein